MLNNLLSYFTIYNKNIASHSIDISFPLKMGSVMDSETYVEIGNTNNIDFLIFKIKYFDQPADVFVTSKFIHLYILYCISLYPDVPIDRIINIIYSCKVIVVNHPL